MSRLRQIFALAQVRLALMLSVVLLALSGGRAFAGDSVVMNNVGSMYGTAETDFIIVLEKVGPFVLLVLVAILGIRFGWRYLVKFSKPR